MTSSPAARLQAALPVTVPDPATIARVKDEIERLLSLPGVTIEDIEVTDKGGWKYARLKLPGEARVITTDHV